jgi:hypothetical protein
MTSGMAYVAEICRLYVVVLLFASAGGKSFAFFEFERTLSEAMSVPAHLGRCIALGIVGAEYLAAMMSATGGVSAEFGMAMALLLSVLFTGFVATMLVQEKSIRCNCFGGASNDKISAVDLVRNAILMAACAFYLLGPPSAHSLSIATSLLLLPAALIGVLLTANVKGVSYVLREW